MLVQYDASAEHDALLARWWVKLTTDGDLERLFCPSHHTLAPIMRMMQRPNAMLFAADSGGIWWAMWFEPLMGSVCAGVWVARERRGCRQAVRLALDAHERVLQKSPTVMGVTCQERLLRLYERMGYTVLGRVPGLWDGAEMDAWLVMLTRPAFVRVLRKHRLVSVALEEAVANG